MNLSILCRFSKIILTRDSILKAPLSVISSTRYLHWTKPLDSNYSEITRDIPIERIRNFSIIAHIDHGKSTLADRILEFVGAIKSEGRKNEQVLDKLPVERERGITVKAQTVSFRYKFKYDEQDYLLNLIDTPGHVDFSYEVSRSLAACQGVVLLVDANQGVQAQTVANFFLASERSLVIVPVLNKIDLKSANPDQVSSQIQSLFGVPAADVLRVSAKFGAGVEDLLDSIVERIPPPPPPSNHAPLTALVFDSWYNQYRGTVALIVVLHGSLRRGDKIEFFHSQRQQIAHELGVFEPEERSVTELCAGHVGFVLTGIKETADVHIGETVFHVGQKVEPIEGFKPQIPVVFAGLYPLDKTQYSHLAKALDKLMLNDPGVSLRKDFSAALGPGWMVGFLGILHLEVFRERLEQEFDAPVIVTSPNVIYKVKKKGKNETEKLVHSPAEMPDPNEVEYSMEPIAIASIITPIEYGSAIESLCLSRRGEELSATTIEGNRIVYKYKIPLSEIIVDFFDALKSVSSGYASFDYSHDSYVVSNMVRVDFLVNSKPIDELSLIAHADHARELGRDIVLKLKDVIERQMFKIVIQAAIGSKIIARENISPYKKDVTAKCYGGDMSRKIKLLKKQAEGKRRMRLIGKVEIPNDAFIQVLKRS